MPRLEDNSYASREQRARERDTETLGKVTTGVVKSKKKSAGRKILDIFLSEKIDEVGDYVKYNIFGPGIKSLVYEIVAGTISMMFWGDASIGRRSARDGAGSKGYDRRFDERRDRERARSSRSAYDIEDILFETRDDAERVLDRLYDLLDRYGKVRVADLYSAAGISPEGNYTVNYYGWYSLRGAGSYPTSEGWALDLPKCESLR